jgi:protease IV
LGAAPAPQGCSMKKFLIGLVVGVLFTILTVVIVGFAAIRLGDRRPSVEAGSILAMDLSGDLPEVPPTELPLPGFEGQTPLTVQETWAVLRNSATDDRIKALLLKPTGLGMGWAKLQELRDGVLRFRKSGKPVYVYLQHPGTREYFLATAADKVYMSPEDVLDVKGMRVEMMFLKNTMDKVGAKVEVEHAGKYKDAADMFVRESMSPETREVMNSMLDGLYGELVRGIAQSRKKNETEVRALIDKGPFLAKAALGAGLVDGLKYADEVESELAGKLGQSKLEKISYKNYLRSGAAGSSTDKNRIAFVVGSGSIYQGSMTDPFGQESGIGSTSFSKLLQQVRQDSAIKGVVLRVDSPGGDATASDEILREVKLLSKAKPTVISFSDVAASGGYYISVSGDPIIAYPDTITGSIGVIYGKLNIKGLYNKLGIQKDILKRGEFADLDSDYQELGPGGRARLRELIDTFYQGFVSRVAEGRKKKYEEIHEVAQGRVWLGAQARANGLVDELGGLDKAIEMIKKRANIPQDQAIRLVAYPGRKTLFERLFEQPQTAIAGFSTMFEPPLERMLKPVLTPDLLRGGVLTRMPFEIVVK